MTARIRQHTPGILLALITVGILVSSLRAQTVTLVPDEVINGIETSSSDQFHQRFDITLGGTANAGSRAFTITVPAELTVLTNSITATTNSAVLNAFFAGSSSSTLSPMNFGVTGTAGGAIVTVEFDLKTPTVFTGVPNGGRVDTVYTLDFSSDLGSQQTVQVSKLQNLRLQQFQFASPDSSIGDTTTLGGRFYKLQFPSALPDFSHTGLSGLSLSNGVSDGQTDILYTFYLSTDSSLVTRPTTLAPAKMFTLGADRTPLVGQRQRPRQIDATFIREDYTATFAASTADSVNGVISLEETADNAVYYAYVLADPAPTREPSGRANGGSAKAGFDNSRLGAFSGEAFLARSGPLLVNHPPEFIIVGWDYDNDGGDQFSQTGILQVPSDIPGMALGTANRKDNRIITLDTGSFVARGAAISSLNSGNTPSPVNTVTMLFLAEDVDNPSDFDMRIFMSTQSGLTATDFVDTGIDSLSGSIFVTGSDSLTINNRTFDFIALTRDSLTQLVETSVPEGSYFVYFGATDGDDDHRVLVQVQDDPFDSSPSFTTTTVTHSPNLSPDSFVLNDFTNPNDGDLDVITGIDVSQMQADADGKDLRSGPATRAIAISWGETGLSGDIDVDDNAQIDFYYSTRSEFRDASKSDGYTSGNSDGNDLLTKLNLGDNDTHTIITGVDEDPDGLFDNQISWDIWKYVSPTGEGGTVPRTDTRYYVYAIITGGSTSRLISFTESSAVGRSLVFSHPPYIRGLQPVQDIQVSVEDPVVIAWEAVDVDNGGGSGAAVPTTGLVAGDGSASSPNIRIILTSADFGPVTTWGSITSPTEVNRMWVANSTDGSLGSEIELNEGVDTSFVMVGNRLRNNLGAGASDAALELQTNSGFGQTYFVYLAIDGGLDGTVGDQPTNFSDYSPVVKAPGRITFTGVVPASPTTSVRFIVPPKLFAIEDDTLRIPITPDDGSTSGRQIDIIDIFMSFDDALFEPIDTDSTTTGIQPFTLGANTSISASNVQQIAHVVNGVLSFEFIYTDQVNGLTFFDGVQTLAFANFKSKPLSGGPAVQTFISIDSQDPRRSKMLDPFGTDIQASVPPPIEVRILPRSGLAGTLPLQGRLSSADTISFYLREIGSFDEVVDPFFVLNDIQPDRVGVQVESFGVNGDFQLNTLPSGRFILVAKVDRHLAGHDTLDITPGLDITGFQPTIDGAGVDRGFLPAGDVAGVNDSTGTSLPDNFIDSQDLNAINSALFSQTGESSYNTFADINRDGIINATDKDFSASNVTDNTSATQGIRPVLPTFKRAAIKTENNKALVSLSWPEASTLQVGEVFDVTIEVEGVASVRTYEFHLLFDPAVVTPVDLVSNGTILGDYRTDVSGKILEGDLGIVTSILGRTEIGGSGKGTLGTVRLKAIKGTSHTQVSLDNVMLIDVEHVVAQPRLGDPIAIDIEGGGIAFHDANGEEILGLILADEDPRVDFNDFIALTQSFGYTSADAAFDTRADLNEDGRIDFADFLIFTMHYGKVAIDAPSSVLTKPVGVKHPSDGDSKGVTIKIDEAESNEERVVLSVSMYGVRDARGWVFELSHDMDAFEFLGARLPRANLLEKEGDEAPLLLVKRLEDGRTLLANAIIGDGEPVSGDGKVVEAVFGVRGASTRGTFRVSEGAVYDGYRKPSGLLAAEKEVYVTGPSHSSLLGSIRGLFESIRLP
jgi:hypothetical protein